jgi:hypothetical protein
MQRKTLLWLLLKAGHLLPQAILKQLPPIIRMQRMSPSSRCLLLLLWMPNIQKQTQTKSLMPLPRLVTLLHL